MKTKTEVLRSFQICHNMDSELKERIQGYMEQDMNQIFGNTRDDKFNLYLGLLLTTQALKYAKVDGNHKQIYGYIKSLTKYSLMLLYGA